MSLQFECSTIGVEPFPSARDALAEANHRIANSLSMVAGLVRMYIANVKESRALRQRLLRSLVDQLGAELLLRDTGTGLAVELQVPT